ncbi:DNA repair helicase [Neocallimastix californiae]|uniref:ATP-dependent DNA helicase CHL1 n=1 Tax=Neocallimastix californiae TaxID=1754190 RepID=A0A1Y2B1T1_9FUNG|nr:DNA repair helicase [Neocallimastix californiae]|eukprot:ORY28694.1 DNA repair helicase [Neocallimastix californiae]
MKIQDFEDYKKNLEHLKTPSNEEFSKLFPFKPYTIQLDFMSNLYSAIEDKKKVVILESPTGTGKSLSLICSVTKWLIDNEERLLKPPLETITNFSAKKEESTDNKKHKIPQWVLQHFEEKEKQKQIKEKEVEENDEDFLLDEYDKNNEKEKEKELEEFQEQKIYYSSRTHSQISQFTFELKKSVLGKTMKCVSLGSRKNLCINPKVRNLSSLNRMNDKCLDMNEGKKTKCTYLCNENEDFKDIILSDIYDIEELASLGIMHENCPYYGSRSASKMAQIITLPYNLLIQKSSREALGLNLKDSIIIFDEAHNIIDTITNTYSFMLDSEMIVRAISDINQYLEKYKNRLKGKNIMYIQQILVILNAFQNYILNFKKEISGKKSYLSTINEFLIKLNIDHLNLLKIKKYLETSRLPQKLLGFTKKYINKISKEEDDNDEELSRHVSPLMVVENFIFTLSNQNKDGRILIYEESFKSLVEEARTVVLAGGTLEPISDFIEQLFPYLEKDKEIVHYSYDHVIDSSSLLTMIIEKGPIGTPFLFNYENRNNPKILKELGQLILNVVNVIPDGIVIFFPSYLYLNEVYEFWDKNNYLKQIENKKKIFKEPKNSKLVEKTLNNYSEEIKNGRNKGAVLLCVVGGKMSEGRAIRHKNDYACVLLLDKRFSQPRIRNKLPKWMSKNIQNPQAYGLFIGKMAKFFKSKKDL